MKNKLSIYIVLLLAVTGCKKYLDVNEDPRTPQSTTAETLLPHIQSYMGNALGLDGRFTGKYIQYWASQVANEAIEGHGAPSSTGGSGAELWTMHYTKMGLAIDQMLQDAITNEKWGYAGIAKVLRAWSWQISTDHFGPMVYHQAWETDRYIFDYDHEKDIYAGVEKLCQEALQYFGQESTKTILSSSDYMFYGIKDKWIKFTYGVLAINAHHLSNKPTYNPEKVIEYCDKSMSDTAHDARIEYLGTTSGSGTTSNSFVLGPIRGNITFRTNTTTIDYVQSSVIVGMLNGAFRGVTVVDPRIHGMLSKSPDGNYYGAVPTAGDVNRTPTSNPKRIPGVLGSNGAPWPGKYLFKDAVRFPVMTSAQILFIKAEAAFKAGRKGDAYTAYKAGIDQSIRSVSGIGPSIHDTTKTNYLNSSAVAQSEADLKISDIMCQKYIALWGWGFEETWADMRRYHYDPAVYVGFLIPDPTKIPFSNNGKLAYRFRPQTTEFTYNIEALQKIGATRQDYHTDETWFSNPNN